MTSPKGHVPPSQRSCAPKKPALADNHLIVKERLKLMRAGACDKTTNTSLMGDGIYGRLNDDGYILWPVGISSHGKWGPSFTTTSRAKEEAMTTNSLGRVLRLKNV